METAACAYAAACSSLKLRYIIVSICYFVVSITEAHITYETCITYDRNLLNITSGKGTAVQQTMGQSLSSNHPVRLARPNATTSCATAPEEG